MILWRGKSRLTKKRDKFNVIITGLKTNTKNEKTGKMLQMWILPELPLATPNIKKGKKNREIVCGDCPLLTANACYVNVAFAPIAIQNALKRGKYPPFDINQLKNKSLRYGSYGEPSLLPIWLIKKINKIITVFTGYTHQWMKPWCQPYKKFFMASCHTIAGKKAANKLGWRTFRVVASLKDKTKDEIECPASKEYKERTGKTITCEQCNLCCGASARTKKNICIVGHGGKVVGNNILKLVERDNQPSNPLRILNSA